jgi:HEAT repeat protein
MSVGSFVLLLAALPAQTLPAAPATPATALSSADEETLKSAHIAVAGPALLDFLHKRSGAAVDKGVVAGLVKQLADPSAAAHDAAAGQLVALGETAVPALREAANGLDDPDSAGRARQCLLNIEDPQGAELSIAVVHAAAALQPDGAVEALLEYLPFAENEKVAAEVEVALAALAPRNGKPAPALVCALNDPAPSRRAAAAIALCRVGGENQYAAVRALLKDPKPTVRLRAALALADARSADAIPVIIDLLADLPLEQRKQAEEFLTNLAGEWAITGPAGNDATSRRLRRDAWAAWWRGMDDAALLDEFTTRTMTDEERDKALALIRKLDDASAEVREKAFAELVGMGQRVTSLLRQAALNPDARIESLAGKCLQLTEKDSPNPLPAAAGRMLALRAPAGAVAALLAYLPYADNEASTKQLRDMLSALALHEAGAVPVLVKALDDKIGVRRGAAAVALCRRGAGVNLPAVKKLFKDSDLEVRLTTALGVLTAARDKDAVPALIDLLARLPADRVWEAEEMLTLLAGDKAPSASVGGDAAAREKAREAWAAWWTNNSDSVDLAKLNPSEPRELGYLLIIENQAPGKPSGRVLELDGARKIRWKVENVFGPQDAQVVGGNRVLIIDNNGQRVSERETATGKILWEKPATAAFRVQRLANGNTFVACRNMLLEFDRAGKEVLNLQRPNEYLLDAKKLRDGQIATLNNQGGYARTDAAGKEVKPFQAPFDPNFGIGVGEVLANDHVLIASPNTGKVHEYDAVGKMVMEAAVPLAGNFFRLSNGHTLVTCQNQAHIVELDKTGKVVNEMKDLPYHPWRVSRR